MCGCGNVSLKDYWEWFYSRLFGVILLEVDIRSNLLLGYSCKEVCLFWDRILEVQTMGFPSIFGGLPWKLVCSLFYFPVTCELLYYLHCLVKNICVKIPRESSHTLQNSKPRSLVRRAYLKPRGLTITIHLCEFKEW